MFLAMPLSVAAAPWQQSGPVAVVVTSLASSQSGILYAGTMTGGNNGQGVFKSADGGYHWQPANGSGAGSLPTNRGSAGRVYAVAVLGETVFLSYVNPATGVVGLYKSVNGGGSWALTPSGLLPTLLLARTGNLFAVSGNSIHRSIDGGDTWAVVHDNKAAIPYLMEANGTLFASGYRSFDNGATWSAIPKMDMVYGSPANQIAYDGTRLYAATPYGSYISQDGGDTWSLIGSTSGWNCTRMVAIPGMALMFRAASTAGLGSIFKSTDSGQSWQELLVDMPGDENRELLCSLVSGGGFLVSIGNFGIYRTSDAGLSWNTANLGFEGRITPERIAARGKLVLAATGSSTLFRSDDGGASWIQSSYGIPRQTTITALALTGTAALAGASGKGIYRSADEGRSWVQVFNSTANITTLDAVNGHLYAAVGSALLRSADDGLNWENTGGAPPGEVSMIVGQDGLLFANSSLSYASGGIFRSSDEGVTWEQVGTGLLVDRYATIAVIDTAVFVGTVADMFYRRIYRSVDSGNTWVDLTGNLTANELVLFSWSGRLFASYGHSIYADEVLVSTDLGVSRVSDKEALPNWLDSVQFAVTDQDLLLLLKGASAVGLWRKPLLDYVVQWDIDGNARLDLADALLALQTASAGMQTAVVSPTADADGDGKIGPADAILIVQKLALLR
ncbi:MAG: hypothetical protein AB1568_11595 [Thermodesulfobacteriota bacterium]